jgi:MtN3 and saliva related transmembrane protein
VTDALGWFAATILLLTIGRQVYTQWRDKTCVGVSRWLFRGQIVASVSFVAYSWLLGNWVFVVTNAAMLLIAILGQVLYLQNKGREASPAAIGGMSTAPISERGRVE